jgi:protein ImuB
MFVWLPNFAMTLARLKEPPLAKPRQPLALLEKHGNIRRIAALDEPAVRAGLHLHQPLADALAVYPKLAISDAEPEACEQALTALAAWAQRYSPATAPAPPSGLWLDITGCSHLWGGEAGLAKDLLGRLEARGIQARAAIAPTFGAAYALAHHAGSYVIADDAPEGDEALIPPHPNPLPPGERGRAAAVAKTSLLPSREKDRMRGASIEDDGISKLPALLASLPIERLRIGDETAALLRKLGLFTIGDVQRLPRSGLSRRFPDLLPQLDKAVGLAQEAIGFLPLSLPWIERMRFAEPISAPEDLERITVKLLERLCKRLEAERQGGLAFEMNFFRCDGGVQTQTVSTALPTRDPARVMRLFREKLVLIDPGFGVDLAMLAVPRTEPLNERQVTILRGEQSAACVEELAALIDALENRLGKGRVYRLAPVESYIPERAVKREAPLGVWSWQGLTRPSKPKSARSGGTLDGRLKGGHDKRIWQSIGERPIRLFARPQPIDVTAALPDAPPMLFRWRKVLHRIARAEGPERISPEWWRGGDAGEGMDTRDYYRVESTAGLRFWVFREGAYGAGRMPRWFLHGLFP